MEHFVFGLPGHEKPPMKAFAARMNDAHQRTEPRQMDQQCCMFIPGSIVKFNDKEPTGSSIVESVLGYSSVLCFAGNRGHRRWHNELELAEFTAPALA